MQTQGKRELSICLVDRTRQASLILLKVQLNAFRQKAVRTKTSSDFQKLQFTIIGKC